MLQKIIVRIMAGAQPTTPCTSLLKKLVTVPVLCQYVLLLINLMTSNQENFQANSSIYNTNTRNKHHLHRKNAKMSCFQKSTLYTGIKIFNNLPPSVTIHRNDKAKFKAALRKCLHTPSCYCVDEVFVCKDDLYSVFVNCF